MKTTPAFEAVIAAIEQSRGELIDLCVQLGNTPSPHGQERAVGEAVLEWLKQRDKSKPRDAVQPQAVNLAKAVLAKMH